MGSGKAQLRGSGMGTVVGGSRIPARQLTFTVVSAGYGMGLSAWVLLQVQQQRVVKSGAAP